MQFIGNGAGGSHLADRAERGKLFCPSCGAEFDDIDENASRRGLTCRGCGKEFRPSKHLRHVIKLCLGDRKMLRRIPVLSGSSNSVDQDRSTPCARCIVAALIVIGILPIFLTLLCEACY